MCKLCDERGLVHWGGGVPKCAFDNSGMFISDNWCCATMTHLRYMCEESAVWNEDQNAAILTGVECQHVILSWYKRRGRTEGAFMLTDGMMSPLNETEALKLIERDKSRGRAI